MKRKILLTKWPSSPTIKKLYLLRLNVGGGLSPEIMREIVCLCHRLLLRWKSEMHSLSPSSSSSVCWNVPRERVGQEVFEQRRKRNPTTGLFLSVLSLLLRLLLLSVQREKGRRGKNFMQRLSMNCKMIKRRPTNYSDHIKLKSF